MAEWRSNSVLSTWILNPGFMMILTLDVAYSQSFGGPGDVYYLLGFQTLIKLYIGALRSYEKIDSNEY